jgi:hypothetical protein
MLSRSGCELESSLRTFEHSGVAPDAREARGGRPALGRIPLDDEPLAGGRHFCRPSSVARNAPRAEAAGGIMRRQKRNVRGQVVRVAVVRTRVDQFDEGAVGRRVRELRMEPEGFKPAPVLPAAGCAGLKYAAMAPPHRSESFRYVASNPAHASAAAASSHTRTFIVTGMTPR